MINQPQTTDFIAQLRQWARITASEDPFDLTPERTLYWVAADEIERLRNTLHECFIASGVYPETDEQIEAVALDWVTKYHKYKSDAERYRAALQEVIDTPSSFPRDIARRALGQEEIF